MDNITLGQIQEQIEFNRSRIELLFKTLNTSDNFLSHTDHMHGKRNISIFIRLDELSISKLDEVLPTIKQVFAEYQALRQKEKELMESAMIEHKVQQGLLDDIIRTKTSHSTQIP